MVTARNLIVPLGSEVGILTQNSDSTARAKNLSLPDITPVHIQAQIPQQEHISLIRVAALSSMYGSHSESSHSSSRSRRDPDRHRSHSSYKDHHTREDATRATELSSLLNRCKLLEATLRDKENEISTLQQVNANLLAEQGRLQAKLSQQRTARATAVANALAAAARSAPTPPPTPPKHPKSSTPSLSHPKPLGSPSTESLTTSSSKRSYQTSTASTTTIHGIPTYHDEYMAHIQSFDVFMTKTDSWSGAQVIQAVKDLNTEIQQFTSSLVDIHFAQPIDTAINPTTLARAQENTTTRLGALLTHLLSARDDSRNLSMIIQPALQAALCTIIDRALTSFCLGFPAKYDHLLRQLYLRISAYEPQATSSRWRSLTHKYITDLIPTLEEKALDDLVDDALRWSMDILTLSGTHVSKVDLKAEYLTQLELIAHTALRIAKATKELVLSTNFEVVNVEAGTDFTRNRMANVFDQFYPGGARDGSGEVVLCTTEVGLRCFSANEVEERTLLQPSVILVSFLHLI